MSKDGTKVMSKDGIKVKSKDGIKVKSKDGIESEQTECGLILTWIHPLHAIGKGDVAILLVNAEHTLVYRSVGDEVVASP